MKHFPCRCSPHWCLQFGTVVLALEQGQTLSQDRDLHRMSFDLGTRQLTGFGQVMNLMQQPGRLAFPALACGKAGRSV